jgi:prolyl-tRNA synthetase
VVVKDTDGAVTRAASALVEELKVRGVRVRLDDNVAQGFGWRATEWDLQGVPIRVELGPRDLAVNAALLYRRDTSEKNTVGVDNVAQGFGWRATEWDLQGVPIRVELGPRDLAVNAALLYRRDTREKNTVGVDNVVDEVWRMTGRIQSDMLQAATARRDAIISDCTTLNQASDVAQTGIARLPWALVGASGEQDLAASGLTVRCLQLSDGSLPATDDDSGALAFIARAY